MIHTSITSRGTPGLGPSAYWWHQELGKRGMLNFLRSMSDIWTLLAMLSFCWTVKPGHSMTASVKRLSNCSVRRDSWTPRFRLCCSKSMSREHASKIDQRCLIVIRSVLYHGIFLRVLIMHS